MEMCIIYCLPVCVEQWCLEIVDTEIPTEWVISTEFLFINFPLSVDLK